jgi:hypothetical protein
MTRRTLASEDAGKQTIERGGIEEARMMEDLKNMMPEAWIFLLVLVVCIPILSVDTIEIICILLRDISR